VLFGKEFKDGSSILLILSTAQLINVSFASFETVILMSSYKKQLFNLNIIVVIFNLFVNLILINYLGLIGVAYGTLLTIILNKSLQYLIVKNKVLKYEFVKTT
jgi:O-antigen/teichoic acid export membrane protein